MRTPRICSLNNCPTYHTGASEPSVVPYVPSTHLSYYWTFVASDELPLTPPLSNLCLR